MYPQIVKAPKNDAYNWIIQFIDIVEVNTDNHQPPPPTPHSQMARQTHFSWVCSVAE